MPKYTDTWVDTSIETTSKNGILCRIQKRRNPETHKLEQRVLEFTPQKLTNRIKSLEEEISDMHYNDSYEIYEY